MDFGTWHRVAIMSAAACGWVPIMGAGGRCERKGKADGCVKGKAADHHTDSHGIFGMEGFTYRLRLVCVAFMLSMSKLVSCDEV